MIALPFPNRRFMQACWVVPDLDAAIADWVETAGVGPFFTVYPPQLENAVYRGKSSRTPLVAAALSQAGDVQIELVCQLDDQPSIFRELVPAGKTGFHHVAIYSDNYDEDVAYYTKAGAEVAYSAPPGGPRICWVDTSPKLGFMIEIMSASPAVGAICEKIRAAAENWDGKDPIRNLA